MASIPAAIHAPDERRGLLYPFGAAVPAPGEIVEVADGIFWVRMPLPMGIDHINLWVLDGGDHWAIVDTGVALPVIKEHWRALLSGPLAGKPVGRLIVTHFHPDHVGLAGWFATKFQVPLEMSRAEYHQARVLTLDAPAEPPEEALRFYAAQGWPAPLFESMRKRIWGGFGRGVHRLPIGYKRIAGGERLQIGGRSWQLVTGSGHSPEHICLLDPQAGILIAGDQVLPRITSNVSVYPDEPLADPLGDWLDSIAAFHVLPDDLLVLPSHNEPFTRLHTRLGQLAADHHQKLEALLEACTTPLSVWDSLGILFRREIGAGDAQIACGEALAHFHWLERRGQVERLAGEAVWRFRRTA